MVKDYMEGTSCIYALKDTSYPGLNEDLVHPCLCGQYLGPLLG